MAAGRLAVWLLSALRPFLLEVNTTQGGRECYIDSMYSFGDSIADTGNTLRLGPSGGFAPPSASLPYGSTYKKPTGRCSDGLLMIDYFADAFNLPYLSPYLDKSAKFDRGVNFAVAGATALDLSFFRGKGIMLPYSNVSLDVQVGWFNDHLKDVCSSKEDCSKKFEKALFFVGEIGGNDYNYALMQGKSIDEVKTYVPEVVGRIMNAAKTVIDAGGNKIIVPGNFPLGCVPCYLTIYASGNSTFDERNCLKDLNDFASFHNEHLRTAIADIKKDNPQVNISYADHYNTFLDLIDRADTYGLSKSSLLKACCGTGGNYNFNFRSMCGNPAVPVCPDPTKSISWDGIHLTQQAYKDMASQLLSSNEVLKQWKCQGKNL
uniref:GDSL esterase/lipase At1g28570 n=1 Tax=Anthurium amnicola TaxID=1678845 RepID=A0A1D1Z6H2_9ARAE